MVVTVKDRIYLRLAKIARAYKRERIELIKALARIDKTQYSVASRDMHYATDTQDTRWIGHGWPSRYANLWLPLCGPGKGIPGPTSKDWLKVSCMRCLKLRKAAVAARKPRKR